MGEQQTTRAEEGSPIDVFVVVYVEVAISAATAAAAGLRQYREASRMEAGLVRLEVLQQRGRPDLFAIVAHWRDQQALDTHTQAAHAQQLHDTLQPLRVSPFDERLHTGLVCEATPGASTASASYVVTHADAIPPAKDGAIVALQQLATASRNDPGHVRFDVLQQRSRLNHFTIVEIWQDQQSLEAHIMAAHTRQFREAFQPMTGSLYDARLYQALD